MTARSLAEQRHLTILLILLSIASSRQLLNAGSTRLDNLGGVVDCIFALSWSIIIRSKSKERWWAWQPSEIFLQVRIALAWADRATACNDSSSNMNRSDPITCLVRYTGSLGPDRLTRIGGQRRRGKW